MDILFAPPLAFPIYICLVAILAYLGARLSKSTANEHTDTSLYASGEAAPEQTSLPGYRPFFRVALFFAVLHLGAIILATSDMSLTAVAYLLGLVMILVALILG